MILGQFDFIKTEIEGLFIVEPKVHEDTRGYFIETYNYRDFKEAGLDTVFVQDNQSKSRKGVLRGLHYQKEHPQAKLVRAVAGEVFDASVDIRPGSPTYKKWFGMTLSGENKRQLYIPPGFAHGFLVLSDEALFQYKCSDFCDPGDEGHIAWNDPEIGIDWPVEGIDEIIISDKDKMKSRW